MGDAVDEDRVEARVAEDDFVRTRRRRVAVVAGLDVGGQDAAQLGQPVEERVGDAVGFGVAVVGAFIFVGVVSGEFLPGVPFATYRSEARTCS